VNTTVLFFSKDQIFPVLKVHKLATIEDMFRARSDIIKGTISTVEITKDKITGAMPDK
jgi:hypothetical protein